MLKEIDLIKIYINNVDRDWFWAKNDRGIKVKVIGKGLKI